MSLLFLISHLFTFYWGFCWNFVKMLRVSRNLYFVMNEYLIDIGKDKGNTIAESIYIGKQKIVLLPKFRKNQRETIENALMHDKDSSTDNVF